MGKENKKKAFFVPKDLVQAAQQVRDIGKKQRQIEAINNRLTATVEALKKEAIKKVLPLEKEISDKVVSLFIFASENRSRLTKGKKRKIINLSSGWIGWRLPPPSVLIEGNEEELIERLEASGLENWVRTKKTINKEAVLDERDIVEAVPGIKISQEEQFMVKPAQTRVGFIKTKRKFKREE